MSAAQTLTFTLSGKGSEEALPPALRRACDRCRRRKTRCDGLRECANCFKAPATCTYLASPQRKGPKKRGHRTGDEPVSRRVKTSAKSHATAPCPAPCLPIHIPHGNDECSFEVAETALTDQPAGDVDSISTGRGSVSSLSHTDATPASEWSQSAFDLLDNTSSVESAEFVQLERRLSVETPNTTSCQFANSTFLDPSETFPSLSYNLSLAPNEYDSRLPYWVFVPYVRLFFDRLYPIFPVLDKQEIFETLATYESHQRRVSDQQYAFLSALSAAVTVQLNIDNETGFTDALSSCRELPDARFLQCTEPNYLPADTFVKQCLDARQQWDFMETLDDYTIMTSFFLFAFYGNKSQAHRAWYYLRESIGFALSLGMDEPDTYEHLEKKASQRRRRLFWLLFVTERAYALQHRSGVMLRPSIELATIFESEEPKLIYGFVNLVSIFRAIDETFVMAWKGQKSDEMLMSMQNKGLLQGAGSMIELEHIGNRDHTLGVLEIDETQRLDIMVSRQWLHMLAWRLQHEPKTRSKSLTLQNTLDGRDRPSQILLYPFKFSKELLGIISSARRLSLESHGIGMEQKIFDVASCLNDVLSTSTELGRETFSFGHQMLHGFMTTLARFRNQESQYLQPLLAKAANTLASGMQMPQQLLMSNELKDAFPQREDCDQLNEINQPLE